MPSFVTMTGPGTATVTDDAAVAIVAQTTALTGAIALAVTKIGGIPKPPGSPNEPGTLIAIEAQIANVNTTLVRIADTETAIKDQLFSLNIALAGLTSATSNNTSVQTMLAVNQIKTNNFQVAVTKDGLKAAGIPEPVMPTIVEQIQTAISEALEFASLARVAGFFTDTLNSIITGISTFITGTAVYKTVSAKLEEYKNALFNVLTPPSPAAVKAALASQTGAKDIPGSGA
jgi:hypothetical protein